MKLSKNKLNQIIQEEYQQLLNEVLPLAGPRARAQDVMRARAGSRSNLRGGDAGDWVAGVGFESAADERKEIRAGDIETARRAALPEYNPALRGDDYVPMQLRARQAAAGSGDTGFGPPAAYTTLTLPDPARSPDPDREKFGLQKFSPVYDPAKEARIDAIRAANLAHTTSLMSQTQGGGTDVANPTGGRFPTESALDYLSSLPESLTRQIERYIYENLKG